MRNTLAKSGIGLLLTCSISTMTLPAAWAQVKENTPAYSAQNAHSHNDYENDIPFFRAYQKGFGSIEADIFPINGELLVAHNKADVDPEKTLFATYLQPAIKALQKNKTRELNLLIDIKENYPAALALLIKQLQPYQDLLKTPQHPGRLTITISGERPDPADYHNYPDFIYFDGPWPLKKLDASSAKRIEMISVPFTTYSKWHGKGRLDHEEYNKVKGVIDSVHAAGKKIRFWATPDTKSGWLALMQLHVDLIGTDAIETLGDFLNKLPKNIYTNTNIHKTYQPTYQSDGKNTRIKNIILLIGDGMGLAQIYSGYTANQGALNLFKMRSMGLSVTNAADTYITDSAAGGTAMAGGEKTNNRAIGVDTAGKPLKSLAIHAAEAGKKTAVISVGDLADATPAVFYAHQPDRGMEVAIANDMASANIDIILGSGPANFIQKFNGSSAAEKLKKSGYTISYNLNDFLKNDAAKHVGITTDAEARPVINGRPPFLMPAFEKVSKQLDKHPNGFFMMLEGAQVDYGGHANNLPQLIAEELDFDQVVGQALEFADRNGETLIVITADHETGGLSIMDGDIKKGYMMGDFATGDHTGIPVPVFAYGPHSNEFMGVYPNTDIFKRILKLMKK